MPTALVALLDRIGPAILVTHSNAGLFGWLAAARSPNVRAGVRYEPSLVFPKDDMPPPVPLYGGSQTTGTQPAGSPVTAKEFASLARIRVQVVVGDTIPREPIPVLPADGRRARVITSRVFVDDSTARGQGGTAAAGRPEPRRARSRRSGVEPAVRHCRRRSSHRAPRWQVPKVMNDPRIRAFMPKVKHAVNPRSEQLRHQDLEVEGKPYLSHRPADVEGLAEKFRAHAEDVLVERQMSGALEAILVLERMNDVADLAPMLVP